ncbi:hypothetical protein AGMMS50222_03710 [Endomicrobiia bacterium]|nr:hypothetical protein AGMMS49556_04280 [Endomicrobiia bacterium]GHT70210.1 hypothetical protein AGMMS49950_04670 [Endomicrobiia bacterium]GHT74490.1 hypothetical protein AGMMS50222_03710 [Endomicrobiia bacterium]
MKKFLFLALLVLSVFTANVFAAGEVDVWGGCTRLNMDNAFTVGLDCFFDVNKKNPKPGLRVVYLRSGENRISSASVMFGVRSDYDIGEKFNLNGKLFVDILEFNNTKKRSGIKVGGVIFLFGVDPSVGLQYLFTEKFGLGLDLGYRLSPTPFSGFTAKLGLNFKI